MHEAREPAAEPAAADEVLQVRANTPRSASPTDVPHGLTHVPQAAGGSERAPPQGAPAAELQQHVASNGRRAAAPAAAHPASSASAPAVARPASLSRIGSARTLVPQGGAPAAQASPRTVQRLAHAPAWAHASNPSTPRDRPRANAPAAEAPALSPASSPAGAAARAPAAADAPAAPPPLPRAAGVVPLARGATSSSFSTAASADDVADGAELELPPSADPPAAGAPSPQRAGVPAELPAGECATFALALSFGGGTGQPPQPHDAAALPRAHALLASRDELPLLDDAGHVLQPRGARALRPCDLVVSAALEARSGARCGPAPLLLGACALPPNEALASLLPLLGLPSAAAGAGRARAGSGAARGAHHAPAPAEAAGAAPGSEEAPATLVLTVLRRSLVAPIVPPPPPPGALSAPGGAPAASGLLRVRCVTWNMHGRSPPARLPELLHHRGAGPGESGESGQYDVYAIGSQEAERSIEASLLNPSKARWEATIEATLGAGYVLVASHRLAAMHLALFARVGLAPLLSGVRSAHVATGMANRLGNKGAVGVSLMVGGTSFCFVCCHFTAHQNAVGARNADFRRVDEGLDLWPPPGAARARAQTGHAGRASLSARFDRVFWLGDFNYRVRGNRGIVDQLLARRAEVDARASGWASAEECALGGLRVLLRNDQLTLQRAEGLAFRGLLEGEIRFRPTYKFDDRAPELYDRSEKARIPAWTDRVLFGAPRAPPRAGEPSPISLHYYSSVDAVRSSDHRPVLADLSARYELAAVAAPAAAHAPGADERAAAPAAEGAPAAEPGLHRQYTRSAGGRALSDQPSTPKPAGRREGGSSICAIS